MKFQKSIIDAWALPQYRIEDHDDTRIEGTRRKKKHVLRSSIQSINNNYIWLAN